MRAYFKRGLDGKRKAVNIRIPNAVRSAVVFFGLTGSMVFAKDVLLSYVTHVGAFWMPLIVKFIRWWLSLLASGW